MTMSPNIILKLHIVSLSSFRMTHHCVMQQRPNDVTDCSRLSCTWESLYQRLWRRFVITALNISKTVSESSCLFSIQCLFRSCRRIYDYDPESIPDADCRHFPLFNSTLWIVPGSSETRLFSSDVVSTSLFPVQWSTSMAASMPGSIIPRLMPFWPRNQNIFNTIFTSRWDRSFDFAHTSLPVQSLLRCVPFGASFKACSIISFTAQADQTAVSRWVTLSLSGACSPVSGGSISSSREGVAGTHYLLLLSLLLTWRFPLKASTVYWANDSRLCLFLSSSESKNA